MYRIIPDAATFPQVAALPRAALDAYAELLAALEVTPWSGPDAAGQVVYPILEEQREVHLLVVQRLG